MREPDIERDGWSLEDGEARHREHPKSFEIPELAVRQALQPGDFAKLIFKISIEDDEDSVERMWVIVRARTLGGYIGMLDNQPSSVVENDQFWRGTEFPFEPLHIIDVAHATAESLELITQPAPIPWEQN